jgi:hypothetical protein
MKNRVAAGFGSPVVFFFIFSALFADNRGTVHFVITLQPDIPLIEG